MPARRANDADDGERGRSGGGSGADAAVRRKPFSANPEVGARGQRTQQRILDCALVVFGEEGYDRCTIDQITERAQCSRATFYQYFSTKEDLFQRLTGQVARQLSAATEALEPVTADAAGWERIRHWVARQAEIYRRYEPVFHAFPAASVSDEVVATGSRRWRDRNVANFSARVVDSDLADRDLDPVVTLLMECSTRTSDMAGILRSAVPDAYPEDRMGDALADLIHRSLFAFDAKVNARPGPVLRPPVLRFHDTMQQVFDAGAHDVDLGDASRRSRDELLRSGHDAFVRLGYHRTRIDDLVAGADVSHGGFYRYFENKDQLARVLTARAMLTVSHVLADIPRPADDGTPPSTTALRRWLRRYNRTQVDEAAMLRVWVDASLQDATLRANSAPALDWGRRTAARFLRPRGFGDIDTEAVAFVAFLSAFGARPREALDINAGARIIERGFLGR